MQKYECTQCGSHELTELEDNKIKCSYCGTVFRVKGEQTEQPKVIIGKGANVVFGKSSNVTIKGGVKIEGGANVEFHGKLEILEKGDEEKIRNSPFTNQ
jgi:uncharacterized Zn finger protein